MNEVADTRGRILDAAERLFAQEGYDRTSLRAITGRAEVNLAAVNYHFGTKEALLEAVIERRLVPLNEVRMERLRAVLQKSHEGGERPAVGDVLTAFMEPTLRFKESGEGARDFITLVASAVSVPAGGPVRNIFMRMVEPLFRNLFGALREALPGVPEDVLMWRVHFAMGAMLRTMQMFCDEHGPEKGMCPTETDAETVLGVLIPFVTAGMEAP
jgi:AcrR family transcriptional regulator